MSKILDDLVEVAGFVETWRPAHPDFASTDAKAKLKASYKQFHALLVWVVAVVDEESNGKAFTLYLTESVSDISHAYFLNLVSLYKSSRSSLRSGIENFIRVCVFAKGIDATSIRSVYDLFLQAKDQFKADPTFLAILNKLHALYADLCKSVHSASQDYLSLNVPFERLSEFSAEQFSGNSVKLRDVASAVNQALFWLESQNLSKAGYLNADLVLDALPRALKRLKSFE